MKKKKTTLVNTERNTSSLIHLSQIRVHSSVKRGNSGRKSCWVKPYQRNVFNDVVVVKSWHDLGAHLERGGEEKGGKKKKGPPLLVKYACSSSPLCVDLLSTGLIFIVVYIPRVGGYSIQRCRGTRATFNYHPTRSYCWKRGVNEAETIEWYER